MMNSLKSFQPPLRPSRMNYSFYTWNMFNFYAPPSDWLYALTVDGLICQTATWLTAFKYIKFNTPSDLEEKLQKFALIKYFTEPLCSANAFLVNLPFNLVQSSFTNNFNCGFSSEYFLKLFYDGYSLNLQRLAQLDFESTHHECNPLDLFCKNR